jgi:hypothetical protein
MAHKIHAFELIVLNLRSKTICQLLNLWRTRREGQAKESSWKGEEVDGVPLC